MSGLINWCSRLSERDFKFNSYDTYGVRTVTQSHQHIVGLVYALFTQRPVTFNVAF
jgi:hypothetical protein